MTDQMDGVTEVYYPPARPLQDRLYRTPYLVMPRLAIEAMPVEWQYRLEALLAEADAAGMVTPSYHVLRDDPSFTSTTNEDQDDPYSWPREFYVLSSDPWADYRHGNILDLNPEFKVPA